jgi:hypothetical protein
MTKKSTLLLCVVTLLMTYTAMAQTAGDYRSRATGNWASGTTWERFDGSVWINTPTPPAPSSTDGVITIRTGDSVYINAAVTIDQVVVNAGGILTISGATATVANGTGTDLEIAGKVYVSGGTLTSANGVTITIDATGELLHQNNSTISGAGIVTLTNNGSYHAINTAAFTGMTLVNNKLFRLVSANLNFTNTTLTNNDSLVIASITGISNLNSSGASSISNTASGVIHKASSGSTTALFPALTNTGRIKGIGDLLFNTVTSNTGRVQPGNSPGIITVTNNLLSARAINIDIEISTTGAVAGTNFDQLNVSTSLPGVTDLRNATLNIINSASDPIGTTYIILQNASGFTGPFANTTNGDFSLTYNATNVVATKTATLPVTWGKFEALSQNGNVLLKWTTLNEVNTKNFEIQYAKGNGSFQTLAFVAAQTNSSTENNYSYTFTSPDKTVNNLFRIKQVDLDGRFEYSQTRQISFDKNGLVPVTVYPNPVRDVATINVQVSGVQVILSDAKGAALIQRTLQPGQHTLQMQSYAPGIYYLSIRKDGLNLKVERLIKQ